MIITRTPFRMSFFGGGSDLPAYYEQNGGAVLSTSIDKYMYINLHTKFDNGVRLAYSQSEEVDRPSSLQHPLVKSCLQYFNIDSGVEISSIADIPAKGTGLGSSSSYTVGLIRAITLKKTLFLVNKKSQKLLTMLKYKCVEIRSESKISSPLLMVDSITLSSVKMELLWSHLSYQNLLCIN